MHATYRVWNGEKMYYWNDNGLSLTIKNDGSWMLWEDRNKIHIVASSDDGKSVLMWGSGVADAAGRLFYDGSLFKAPVDINNHRHGSWVIYEVVYRNGTWVAQYVVSETGVVLPRGYVARELISYFDQESGDIVFEDGCLTADKTSAEIVGNIYEDYNRLVGGCRQV
ncbi:YopX family protein [Bacillus sp. 1006-3]|uniref:YopX family protein n=1 Tax=Bacillus sp. 1006-3 TaxID=2922309 RepID=UPI001F0E7244|nr:YopX family protein [Bacillus sp. 1006-3]MCH4866641.1 YopX family protein [Bacillus sp. 1006-3]